MPARPDNIEQKLINPDDEGLDDGRRRRRRRIGRHARLQRLTDLFLHYLFFGRCSSLIFFFCEVNSYMYYV